MSVSSPAVFRRLIGLITAFAGLYVYGSKKERGTVPFGENSAHTAIFTKAKLMNTTCPKRQKNKALVAVLSTLHRLMYRQAAGKEFPRCVGGTTRLYISISMWLQGRHPDTAMTHSTSVTTGKRPIRPTSKPNLKTVTHTRRGCARQNVW